MADFAAIVDLINLSASRPQTLAEFVHRDESRPADRPFLRLVAYQDGQLVGTASGGRVTWVKEEDMYGHVTVAPAARRHGVATARL